MTTLAHPQSTRPGDAAALLRAGLTSPFRVLHLWWSRHSARQALLEMDDHRLSDIGLTRGDAVIEWQKAFWER